MQEQQEPTSLLIKRRLAPSLSHALASRILAIGYNIGNYDKVLVSTCNVIISHVESSGKAAWSIAWIRLVKLLSGWYNPGGRLSVKIERLACAATVALSARPGRDKGV